MTAQEIRKRYLEYFKQKDHAVISRAKLLLNDDPTTLFTGSGMQPLIPYLLGQKHPAGNRVVDSQTCFRAEDMDEVGDNRHTTFFEMLGNWSLGDYFKEEQLLWFWEFLTDELNLPQEKLWVTCFKGDEKLNLARDEESAAIWKKLGVPSERIRFYGASENWWSRAGAPENMPAGEPGGPDSEVFYEFTEVEHNQKFGKECHPACDCGRFLEIGNSVFMQYVKTEDGGFSELPQKNVDFGGGLERLAAAVNNNPDIFEISLLKPIVNGLEELSGKPYEQHQASMRVIADHLRAATFLTVDGAVPSNKEQGYVLRRLVRRAVRFAFDLGIEHDLCAQVVPVVAEIYQQDFPEIKDKCDAVAEILAKEEKIFRQTLRSGVSMLKKLGSDGITGLDMFKLYDTYGFPVELAEEEARRADLKLDKDWKDIFANEMQKQRQRSQTAAAGLFRGGLADHSEAVTRLHTVTHLMYRALKDVLGDHVVQRGSNITSERTRFDFSHPEKVAPEQIKEVEDIVNAKITEDLPVSWEEEPTEVALKTASGAFGDKYGDKVKVYTVGNPNNPFSREICGGPHVEHTGQIAEGGQKFKIIKEESSSAGVRRIKAIIQ